VYKREDDGVDWSDVRTTPGLAFGTQDPPTGPPYNDSVALLKATWGPNQKATGRVHTVNQQGGGTVRGSGIAAERDHYAVLYVRLRN
jgi:hypothetical protein